MIYRFLLPLLAALPTSAFVSHTWITPQVIHFSPRHQQCRHYSSSISKETGIIVPSSVEDADKQKTRSLYFMQGLAFNSGFLNGIFLSGIFGRVQAVGPVTDSWTKNAVAFANGDVSRALFVVAVLLSFSMGAFTNGWINPQPELFDLSQRKKPLFLAGTLMAGATVLAAQAHYAAAASVTPLAFFLVCAANGMQNSFSSFATANLCRTSHFTGTTTDLFTILAQCLRGNTSKQERIPIYSGLTVMFWLGGFLGTRWTKTIGHAAICLGGSSFFYLVSAIPSRFPKKIANLIRSEL